MIISRDTFHGSKVGRLDSTFFSITLKSLDALRDPALPEVLISGINDIGRVEVDLGTYSNESMSAAYRLNEIFEDEQENNPLIRDVESSGPVVVFKTWWNPFSEKVVKIIFGEVKFDEYSEAFFDVNKNQAKITIFDGTVIHNEKFISKLAGLIAYAGKVDIDFTMLGSSAEQVAKDLVSRDYVKKLSLFDNVSATTIFVNNYGEYHVTYKKDRSLNQVVPSFYVDDSGLSLEESNFDSILYNFYMDNNDHLTVEDVKSIYEKLNKVSFVDILMNDDEGISRSTGIRFEKASNGGINILSVEVSPYFSDEDISRSIVEPFAYFSLMNGQSNIGLGIKDLITNNESIEVEILKSRAVTNRVDFYFGEDISTLREGVYSLALSNLVSDLINEYKSIGLHITEPTENDYEELELELSERIHPDKKYDFKHVKDSLNKEYILIVT